MPSQDLISDSLCIRVCEGMSVPELNEIADDTDKLVVKSALCITSAPKTMVTTDGPLIEICQNHFAKYGIEAIMPSAALDRLTA